MNIFLILLEFLDLGEAMSEKNKRFQIVFLGVSRSLVIASGLHTSAGFKGPRSLRVNTTGH